jgi:signal transduction histidine kinase
MPPSRWRWPRAALALLDDEFVNDTGAARRPFSWPAMAVIVAESAAACGFVIAVYGLVVGGGTAAWPHASDGWILLLWIAAAAIAGAGMTSVLSGARAVARKALPAAVPYPALMSSVAAVVAAGPAEDWLERLAELLAEGTGARTAVVWLAGPSGLHRAAWWPRREAPDGPRAVTGEAELRGLADVDLVAPVRDAGQLRGALTLRAPAGRFITPPDLRLAAEVANAAGLLLRNAELTERLREQVRRSTGQASELDASRRRVVVATDAAREQLGAEIQARVCAPLERCAAKAELARPGRAESLAGRRLAIELAEMTAAIDAAIADFRQIVHGVYPPVLTDHGLLAALENLVAEVAVPAELVTHRLPRLAAAVEASAYFCAAALLREWDGTGAERPVQVVVGVTSRLVQMTFHDDAADGAGSGPPVGTVVLEAVQDRVAALAGSLRSRNNASGRSLVIEIPLAPADLARPPEARRART